MALPRNSPRKAPVRGKIVVAEDTPELLDLTSRLIRGMGYYVIPAADGEQALALVRSEKPDLLILDILMPKLHGIDVLKTLRAEAAGAADRFSPNPPLPVIMTSGRDFKPDFDLCMELGAAAFLIKPFAPNALAQAIENVFLHRFHDHPPLPTTLVPSAIPNQLSPATPYTPAVNLDNGYWKLWGTRGSIPVTGSRYARHGGNTSCLEISRGNETIIIDAGSGIRDLGAELLTRPGRHIKLLIGHTHWDHIQGFPFFAPAYVPGFQIDLYGAPGFGKDLESIFRGQLDRDYFPVDLGDMAANLSFHRLEENPVTFGDGAGGISIAWEFVNHPGATVGFRIDYPSANNPAVTKSLAYITDNEFLHGYTGHPNDIASSSPLLQPVQKIIDLAADADLLIAEAQYTNAEYPKKIGWGHSSLSNAAVLAREARIKNWIVTHHDPAHDDAALQSKLDLTRQILADMSLNLTLTHAFDGMSQPL